MFELHYYAGYTQAEIARILGLHPKRISRHWIAATGTLAKWLKDAKGLL